MRLDFVKGQMGGNRIVLLDAAQLSGGRALPAALEVLGHDYLCGHQAGWVRRSAEPGRLEVRVVSISWRDFIPACGGLTQVLGKALVETAWGRGFGVAQSGAKRQVTLGFEAWPVELRIHCEGSEVRGVDSDFSAFAQACQRNGIEPVDLDGVAATRVGTFLVLDADAVSERYPQVDFEAMDAASQAVLVELQQRFERVLGRRSCDVALYDGRASGRGTLRAVFPHRVAMGHIEPACGTGSVALALALAASDKASARARRTAGGLELALETGGQAVLGGPELTRVCLRLSGNRVVGASLRHDNVAIVAEGTLSLREAGRDDAALRASQHEEGPWRE